MQRDLVERARTGDHDAFAELAGAAASRLDAAAWLMLRDVEQAKDAVQNCLVRAWRDLPTLRDPDRFDAWIRRLIVRACLDEVRSRRRRPMATTVGDIGHPAVADASSALADQDPIERAFRRLLPAAPAGKPARSSSFDTPSTCPCPRSPTPCGSLWARRSPAFIAPRTSSVP